jgi:hypothetical protein
MTPRSLSTTIACALCALLLACQAQETTQAVPYGAVNHTNIGIASIAINGAGGALNIGKHGNGNAGVCCVVVPRQWTPGLTATVQWQENGHWQRDSNGKFVLDAGGDKQFIEGPWKTRTVPIPRYDGDGDFYVFFFPGDDVRVAMTSSPEWKEWWRPIPADIPYGNWRTTN